MFLFYHETDVGRWIGKYLRVNSAYMPVAASAIQKTYIHVKAQASILKRWKVLIEFVIDN
jgi:hypothetical protein